MTRRKLAVAIVAASLIAGGVTATALAESSVQLNTNKLPARSYFDGTRSIKHARITAALYKTLRARFNVHYQLAVACWSNADWPKVAGESNGRTITLGFWDPRQPRWLHLNPGTCTRIEKAIRTPGLSGAKMGMLVVPLHEAMHAYRVSVEAEANCYAVQTAGLFASNLGLGVSPQRQGYIGQLARNYTRQHALNYYWNKLKCQDGGAWDLDPYTNTL